jgi:hypothetical protein
MAKGKGEKQQFGQGEPSGPATGGSANTDDSRDGPIMARARTWLLERGLEWSVGESGMHAGPARIAEMEAKFILQAIEEKNLFSAIAVLPIIVPHLHEASFLARISKVPGRIEVHPETRRVSVHVVVGLEPDLPLPSHELMEQIFEELERMARNAVAVWHEELAEIPTTWNLADRLRVDLPRIETVTVDWSISADGERVIEADSEEDAEDDFHSWFHSAQDDEEEGTGPGWSLTIEDATATLEDGTEEELLLDDFDEDKRQWLTCADSMTRMVRLNVARHPSTPESVRKRMAIEDPAPRVRAMAKEPPTTPVRVNSGRGKKAPVEHVLTDLARSPGTRALDSFKDERVPPEVLRSAANTASLEELAGIAANPACPPDLLRALARVGA